MRAVNSNLTNLPKSLDDNPQAHLLELCSRFIQEVNQYTNGKPTYSPNQPTFLRDSVRLYRLLERDIKSTRPQFEVVSSSQQPTTDSLDEEVTSLDEVRKVIEQMSMRELYGIIPFQVHEYFIESFVNKWEPICYSRFEEIESVLRRRVRETCNKYFCRFQHSGLLYEVTAVTNEMLDKVVEVTHEEIKLCCTQEIHRPFTMHKTEYIKAKGENMTAFAKLRHTQSLPDLSFTLTDNNNVSRHYPATEENLLKVLEAFGHHLSSSDGLALLFNDEYQAELDVISHITAYFEISAKRVIDEIPQVFETVFAQGFGNTLAKELTVNLNLIGEKGVENCAKYVRDDPSVEGRRRYLLRQREILEKARATMDRFFK